MHQKQFVKTCSVIMVRERESTSDYRLAWNNGKAESLTCLISGIAWQDNKRAKLAYTLRGDDVRSHYTCFSARVRRENLFFSENSSGSQREVFFIHILKLPFKVLF